uniref:F4N2.21 n=1 Tax=Arabidopsis thaliana TaxID=3702 RepID=Q9LQ99_ARATH|nr:F4N2.21 [Arabidopsis thaliana]
MVSGLYSLFFLESYKSFCLKCLSSHGYYIFSVTIRENQTKIFDDGKLMSSVMVELPSGVVSGFRLTYIGFHSSTCCWKNSDEANLRVSFDLVSVSGRIDGFTAKDDRWKTFVSSGYMCIRC